MNQSNFSLTDKDRTITPVGRIFLQQAAMVVDKNISNADFSVTIFAEKMNLSRSQLHRRLTGLTGMSASGFIRKLRLKRAVELMKQGVHPLSAVARQAGFNSTSYFMRCFREVYGVTPSSFQRMY